MLLHLMRRGLERIVNQCCLIEYVGGPGHGPDLGIGQIAFGKPLGTLRQIQQRQRHTHFFPRRTGRDTALHIEPFGAVVKLIGPPSLADIEFADHDQKAVLVLVHVL